MRATVDSELSEACAAITRPFPFTSSCTIRQRYRFWPRREPARYYTYIGELRGLFFGTSRAMAGAARSVSRTTQISIAALLPAA